MHASNLLRPAGRRTQTERRAASRAALLEAAARGISREGYGSLVLERVARDAGFTRGALYNQFSGKEELTLAAVQWVLSTWDEEVFAAAARAGTPAAMLVALARGHIVFCRRDVARVMMALRVEFAGRDHPVGQAVQDITEELERRFAGVIAAGRRDGSIPPGPPANAVARAGIGAIEGLAIHIAGTTRHDQALAARVMRGVLGLAPGAP